MRRGRKECCKPEEKKCGRGVFQGPTNRPIHRCPSNTFRAPRHSQHKLKRRLPQLHSAQAARQIRQGNERERERGYIKKHNQRRQSEPAVSVVLELDEQIRRFGRVHQCQTGRMQRASVHPLDVFVDLGHRLCEPSCERSGQNQKPHQHRTPARILRVGRNDTGTSDNQLGAQR